MDQFVDRLFHQRLIDIEFPARLVEQWLRSLRTALDNSSMRCAALGITHAALP